jgi:predicted DNA-binding transcriptional regulator AlpA
MSHNLVGGLPGLRRKGITWSRQYLGRLERRGGFPKRIHIGVNTIDWIETEVDAFIEEKRRARDTRPTAAVERGR